MKTRSWRDRAQSRPSRLAQDRRSASWEGFDDPGNCGSDVFSHSLDCLQPFGQGGRMSPAADSCRPAVAGASDRSTLRLDAGRRHRAVDRRFEKGHGIAIEAALTPLAERLHPKAANLPFRPKDEVRLTSLDAAIRSFAEGDLHRKYQLSASTTMSCASRPSFGYLNRIQSSRCRS